VIVVLVELTKTVEKRKRTRMLSFFFLSGEKEGRLSSSAFFSL
jgi:hypothetical protein